MNIKFKKQKSNINQPFEIFSRSRYRRAPIEDVASLSFWKQGLIEASGQGVGLATGTCVIVTK